ncbi:histidine kinase dimerization/phosphoacceptor domain -containing protein [uncultured Parasphingopyxis sp.]|uniref:sensor histidine kinase n=2 Tax=Parasphingopyxis TaxID=1234545 RepID=UPI00262AA9D7|nr:histidine kinase dimerization/phosphoacceptor domain -containing protein [uncultured Parasphingopyxis sp.]
MQRLAQYDVSRQFLTRKGQIGAQYIFGLLCAVAMVGLRTIIDLGAPTSGPFALIYPTVLLATLYGHLRAGITALVLTFLWAWYFVLPAPASFAFVDPTDSARVLLNLSCCIVLIIFAEAFRRVAHSTVEQVREAADRRLTLLAELEHRTKNNFALVASMLEIQKHRLADPALHQPLDDAVGRVRTFAEAYSNLDLEHAGQSEVAMASYLNVLLDRLEQAAVPANVELYREIEATTLPREIAVAIGLYLNEALSNCLKYAFPEGRKGTVGVFFHVGEDGWRLTIDDDGIGKALPSDAAGGLGSSLMVAFAQQAGASHSSGPAERGYRAELTTQKTHAEAAAT